METSERIQEAAHALRTEARYLENVADRLESADTYSDLATVFRSIQNLDTGDGPDKDHNWARIMLKDEFKDRGVWLEERQYPDYDNLHQLGNLGGSGDDD